MIYFKAICISSLLLGSASLAVADPLAKPGHTNGPVEPTWDSLKEHYEVPEWFQDGKIGVWFHWGVPSGTDENRPNDGSHYPMHWSQALKFYW